MSSTKANILRIYKAALINVAKHWKSIFLIYVMNLILAYLAIGPLRKLFAKAFENSTLQDQFTSSFDFAIIGDFIRAYSTGISLSINSIISFIIIYFIWGIFYQGGWLAIIKNKANEGYMKQFWQGGAYYFFRLLRLSCFVILFLVGLCSFAFTIFSNGELNPLHVESEQPYITRFWILLFVLFIACFLLSIFKDYAKVYIAKYDQNFIAKSNLAAVRK